MKKLFLFTLLCVTTMTTQAQMSLSDHLTKRISERETCATWFTALANLDWPENYARPEESIKLQKQKFIGTLDKYQKANINTAFLQARVRAATICPLDIESWDQCIIGVEGRAPGYDHDPLGPAAEERHRHGMEIHTRIATIPVGAKNSLGCRTLMKRDYRIRNFSTGSYFDPTDLGVTPYLASICGEIVRKYDVDGINLDYIHYPDGWSYPSYRDGDTPDQRCSNITATVRAIHDGVKAIKPRVKMSCSPIGKHIGLSRYSSKNFNAHDRISQEAQEWMRSGLTDQLYPMQYFRGDNYYPLVADWVENAYKCEIVTGLGTYFLDLREGSWTLGDLTRQMYISRDLGVGHAHSRSYFLMANKQGVYDFEKQSSAMLSPPHKMQGVTSTTAMPYAVNSPLVECREDKSVILRWKAITPYYNTYASHTYPVDTEDARDLFFVRYTGQMLQPKNVNPNLYFVARSMDRYGLETPVLQENMKSTMLSKSPVSLLASDGNILTLPATAELTDADRYVVPSLQGVILRTINAKSVRNNQLYIGSLSNGMYSLKVYNHRKKSFMLGSLMAKRASKLMS